MTQRLSSQRCALKVTRWRRMVLTTNQDKVGLAIHTLMLSTQKEIVSTITLGLSGYLSLVYARTCTRFDTR